MRAVQVYSARVEFSPSGVCWLLLSWREGHKDRTKSVLLDWGARS